MNRQPLLIALTPATVFSFFGGAAIHKAIEIDPNQPDFYNNRANLYFDMGDNNKALADYNMAIKVDPHYSLATLSGRDSGKIIVLAHAAQLAEAVLIAVTPVAKLTA